MTPLERRLWKRLAWAPTGCLVWQGCLDRDGYGKIGLSRSRNGLTHRVAYEVFVGPIPEGMEIDHTCWNRACCNREHLRAVTPQENRKRQRSALKTHCKNGHEMTPENTIIRRSGGGARDCRECGRQAQRRYQQRKRSA